MATKKLLIVNNGLKDLRGHYFETAVSIADAARKIGYRPILAAHVSCPAAIIPDWLEFCPLLCTDHWMATPAPPLPDLHGIRSSIVDLVRTSIESVRDGRATIGDYLRARLEPVQFPADPSEAPASTPVATAPVPSPAPLPNRPSWKARVKALLHPVVPPVMVPPLRWLLARREVPVHFGRLALRNLSPPCVYDVLRSIKRTLLKQTPPAAPPVAAPPPVVIAAPVPVATVPEKAPLQAELERIGVGDEFAHLCAFQRDLERLLCLTGATSADHVFLPTAHGRELAAIERLVSALAPAESPTFHLEFRHSLDMPGNTDDPSWVHPYTRYHQVYFDHLRRVPPHPRISVYTDTEELSEEYGRFSGLEFGTLPIPFRTNLLAPRPFRPGDPLCLAFFGDVRDEKGFYVLPDLVEFLMTDFVARGKVRFLVQGTMAHPEWYPRSQAALERLKSMPAHVTLVGLDGPLSPDDYYQLLSESHVLLCPYSPQAYRQRSSGTLAEGIAAGIPTVVPQGTWLERQLLPGAGETFTDLETFCAGVRRICEHYPRYLMCARAHRDRWLGVHSPRNLVNELLRPTGQEERPRLGKVA